MKNNSDVNNSFPQFRPIKRTQYSFASLHRDAECTAKREIQRRYHGDNTPNSAALAAALPDITVRQ